MAGRHWYLAGCAGLLALCPACTSSDGNEPGLSKVESSEAPKVGPIPEDNPKLGATADIAPIFERPNAGSKRIGYLHAGAKVARAKEPYPGQGCDQGWYPIRPAGFVCVGASAALDMAHPTLGAMALQPDLNQPLPYTYATASRETPLFEQDKAHDGAVKEVSKLRARAVLAVVGSWNAKDAEGKDQRLGLMPNGLFVRASDLTALPGSEFEGVEITKEQGLPVAFVVKRGVNYFKMEEGRAVKQGPLRYHERVDLSGRFRTIDDLRYWATSDDRWIRHKDVTVIRSLHTFPEFATGHTKWVDISIITGSMVLYEGNTPVFATLVSVGRDRLGDPKATASTPLGLFEVVEKHVTDRTFDPKLSDPGHETYDVPWALTLSSGTKVYAATWHDRFGIEHSEGAVHVSPRDGARLFGWATPALPAGWHAVLTPGADKTLVRIRK